MHSDSDQQLAKLHFESGLAYLESNDFLNAELSFKKAYNILPNRPSILINYAATLIRLENWSECEKICAALLAIEPNNLEGILNTGICFAHQNLPEDAIKFFDKALQINDNYLPALINKANALQDVFNPDEALLYYQKVLLLNPRSEEALIGLSNIQTHFKFYELALGSLNSALDINPSNPQALCNKGMLLIRLGQFREGWKLYESRWDIPGGRKNYPNLKIPPCKDLKQLNGKTLAVIAEQGFGDSIQFSRFLIFLLKTNTNLKILFLVPLPLASLFRSLSPDIKILTNNQQSTDLIDNTADYFLPLLSLPHLLKITNPSAFNYTPYLHPSQDKKKWWLDKINSKNVPSRPFRIGITWSGSGKYSSQLNTRRDLPFDEVQRLLIPFDNINLQFHCLHKEFRHGELERIKNNSNIYLHNDYLRTFEDTAALMYAMDLIISIDTSIAHLAGSLNLKHLLLLPEPPDFLSPISGDFTNWYPSTKIIRQTITSEWATVINECIVIINALVKR